MKQLKKSKRISWASGAKLCQVKLFLSEDCPTKVGLQAQDRLQAKKLISCLNGVYSDNYHSRFEGRPSMDSPKEKLSRIPLIKWKSPPKFVLSNNWHVAAGEESEERETQKYREMRVLEAVYPRLSDIPPSSSLPLDVQECHHDDSHIPLIPITPIEEEGAVDLPSDVAAPQNAPFDLKSPALPQVFSSGNPNAPQGDPPASLKPSANEKPALGLFPGFQADVAAAAAAAITAIMKSKEQGSMIDTDLLIKFLSDPKMIEKLITEQIAPVSSNTAPFSRSKPLTSSGPLPSTKPLEELISEDGAPMKMGSSTPISQSKLVASSAAIPGPKPDAVTEKLTNEQGPAAHTGAALISVLKPVTTSVALPSPKPDLAIGKLIHKQSAPTDAGTAPVSASKPAASRIALPTTKPDPVVKILVNEHRARNNAGSASVSVGKLATPPVFLTSSEPDLVKVKRMINEYGTLEGRGNEPITSSVTLAQQVPMSSPELDVVLPARVNSQSSQRLNLNTILNLNQSDLQLKFLSPDTARLNLHPLPSVLKPNLLTKAATPDSVRKSSSFSAMTAPPVKDIHYIKSLIKQHGEMQETQVYNFTQAGKFHDHLQDLKLEMNLKPNELKPKVQKPCLFFKSPKGCRKGSNCPFQHGKPIKLQPGSVPEAPSAKRMKLGGKITGRT